MSASKALCIVYLLASITSTLTCKKITTHTLIVNKFREQFHLVPLDVSLHPSVFLHCNSTTHTCSYITITERKLGILHVCMPVFEGGRVAWTARRVEHLVHTYSDTHKASSLSTSCICAYMNYIWILYVRKSAYKKNILKCPVICINCCLSAVSFP